MFSTNQVLEISGSLDQLEATIDFSLQHSGNAWHFTRNEMPSRCIFQITAEGKYCIGWALPKEETPAGWSELPFDYDAAILARIIEQWIQKAPTPPNENAGMDGSSRIGFLLQEIGGTNWAEQAGIENGNRCIISVRPFWCFYAK